MNIFLDDAPALVVVLPLLIAAIIAFIPSSRLALVYYNRNISFSSIVICLNFFQSLFLLLGRLFMNLVIGLHLGISFK